MTPRPRKRGNRDMPANLYATSTGYEYRHPITGKRHGIGSDRQKAVAAAKILNQKLMPEDDLVARVMGGQTVAGMVQRFREEYLPDRKHSNRTRSEVEYRLKRYERELGNLSWPALTLERLSDWLKPLTREAYRKHRAQWIEIYRFACSVGLADQNIAELTLAKGPSERKRKRWTLEQFESAREKAEPWLEIAMDLALATLQRREDLVNMRWEDIQNGRLLVTQHKTGKRLAIKIGGRLNEILSAARSQGLICPFIIARKPDRRRRSAGKAHLFQVTPSYLSKAVATARDAAKNKGADTGPFDGYTEGERPTLHEFRSLGAHLYREAGYPEEYIQALLGHSDTKMTTHYLDGHKVEYDEVSADLRW